MLTVASERIWPGRRAAAAATRWVASPRAPLVVLLLVSVLSLGARSLFLGQPCQSPCTQASEHTLVFDEAYYVNAARVIAGIHPPAGSHYAQSPLGTDPNAEHPQGAKLIMAGAIKLFGDGPFAWRIGSLLMGTLAILGMFALVRSAGGDPWMAVGAATLMAADNLLLVMGRIATLDIYACAGMVWAAAFYLRGRIVAAGVALAIATAFKEVAPYLLFVLLLVEVGRVVTAWRARAAAPADPRAAAPSDWQAGRAFERLAATAFVTGGVFLGLLAIMDQIAPPYADAEARLITGGPWNEIAHIINYAAALTSPHGPQGIASYPWQWLIDLKPILYLRINPSLPTAELHAIHPVSAFFGMISPPILLLAMPALAVCAYRFLRRPRITAGAAAAPAEAGQVREQPPQDAPAKQLRLRPGLAADPSGGVVDPSGGVVTSGVDERQVAILAVAWFLGTWLPSALESLLDQRTSYLYYMVIVMPGIYVGVAYLIALGWRWGRRWLRALEIVWALGVLAAVIVMYPFVAVF